MAQRKVSYSKFSSTVRSLPACLHQNTGKPNTVGYFIRLEKTGKPSTRCGILPLALGQVLGKPIGFSTEGYDDNGRAITPIYTLDEDFI